MLSICPSWLTLLSVVALGAVACVRQQGSVRPPTPFAGVVGPVVIAHRGGSLEAPENTLAAVRHGVEVGADWQEIDVTLSKDGHVVVIHDDTLERTTDGAGLVEQQTLAQLRALRAGSPRFADYVQARLGKLGVAVPDFAARFPDERIPTLEEVLAIPEARLMIEMKATTRVHELASKVVDLVDAAGASGRVALGSFETALLEAANVRDPTLPLVGIVESAEGLEEKLMLPLSVLAVNVELAHAAMQAAPAGVAVWTWTVYAPEQVEPLIELGVHGLITDAPREVLLRLRGDGGVAVPLTQM